MLCRGTQRDQQCNIPMVCSPTMCQDTPSNVLCTMVSPYTLLFVNALLAFRDEQSKLHGKTRSTLMKDSLLLELAMSTPTTILSLLNIKGLSRTKIAQYGDELLELMKTLVHKHSKTMYSQHSDVPDTIYKDALAHHQMTTYVALGFNTELQEQIRTYNTKLKCVQPFTPRIVQQEHRQSCAICNTLDGLYVGSMYFVGKLCEEDQTIKYCLNCIHTVLNSVNEFN